MIFVCGYSEYTRVEVDVHRPPVVGGTEWFMEWQCLQEVTPTDQSSWPLTSNLQRLEKGLVYYIRRQRTAEGLSIRDTKLNWESEGREGARRTQIKMRKRWLLLEKVKTWRSNWLVPSGLTKGHHKQKLQCREIMSAPKQTMSNFPACVH